MNFGGVLRKKKMRHEETFVVKLSEADETPDEAAR
jgi:hypothetical protein